MLTFPTSETGYARKSMRTTALIHESNRNKNLGLDRINREISNIKTDSVWPLLLTEVSRHENDSNITKLLTLYSDPLFRPVFHLSGEDSTSPHTDYIVSHDELQGIEAKHFDPEKSNFHWWMRTLKHQRNLQDSLILLRVWKIITQVFNLFNSLLKKKKRKKNTKHKTKQNKTCLQIQVKIIFSVLWKSFSLFMCVHLHDYLPLYGVAFCWLRWLLGGRGVGPV